MSNSVKSNYEESLSPQLHMALADVLSDDTKPPTISVNDAIKSFSGGKTMISVEEGVSESAMHGIVGVGRGWEPPRLITFCDEDARPGYNSMKAHEYQDSAAILEAKVNVLAALIHHARHCTAYTGAGISTASGINDYASKAKQSIATGSGALDRKKSKGSRLDTSPSYSHFVLASMHRAGLLSHWVQQNHDGLPQKAGYPQSELNEIHGSWFDPSNPVVPMSGSLREDLLERLHHECNKTDLCLAIGTSLCGMNADSIVEVTAKNALFLRRRKVGLGSVIIGIQRTAMDNLATLRIFAKIDDVMALLAQKLSLDVPTLGYVPSIPRNCIVDGQHNIFRVPYLPNGAPSQQRLRSQTEKPVINWDLSVGARVKLTAGPGKGFEGEIISTPDTEVSLEMNKSYSVRFPCTREGENLGKGLKVYRFGIWWIEAACNGSLTLLPLVNVK